MGNKGQSPSKRSSSQVSTTSDAPSSRNPTKSTRASEFLQQNLQITRNQMIDAWMNLIVKTLKKKGNHQKGWRDTCSRISQAIKQFTRSSYWKVFQAIDLWSSVQIIETRAKELKPKSKQISLKRARCTFIDITSMNQRMTKRTKEREKVQEKEVKSNKQMKESISLILENEFRKGYHPFSVIKSIFIEDIQRTYSYFPESQEKQQDEQVAETLRQNLKAIITFLQKSCQIYKQWIQSFTNLKQKGYNRFISKIIINFLFDPPSQLHPLFIKILKRSNSGYIKSISSQMKENISIKKFNILQELEIEGNYIKSMIMLSEINSVSHPRELIKFFETLKTQIQNDIEFFNKTFDKKEETLIDGDNLLSIICYMLCKMKVKLGDIHAQLILLHVVHGESILTEYDSASYMLTAIMAAIDYLKSQEFGMVIKEQ